MEQNNYSVIVSRRATQMLVSHAAFLAQSSKSAAERLKKAFEEAATSLRLMPQRCPRLTGRFIPYKDYRYLLFKKRYAIIFQIRDNTVYVEYIVDCRQDYSWFLR